MSTPRRAAPLTARQAFKESSRTNIVPEFYLVQFQEDEEVCAVPAKMLVSTAGLSVGGDCQVEWINSETYTATILAQGTRAAMKTNEAEHHNRAKGKKNDQTKENEQPPPKKRKKESKAKKGKKDTAEEKMTKKDAEKGKKDTAEGKKAEKDAEIKKSQWKRNEKENNVFVVEIVSPSSAASGSPPVTAESPATESHSPPVTAPHEQPATTSHSALPNQSDISFSYGEKRPTLHREVTTLSSPSSSSHSTVEVENPPLIVIPVELSTPVSPTPVSPQLKPVELRIEDSVRTLTDTVIMLKTLVEAMDERMVTMDRRLESIEAAVLNPPPQGRRPPQTPRPNFSILDEFSILNQPWPSSHWYQSSPMPKPPQPRHSTKPSLPHQSNQPPQPHHSDQPPQPQHSTPEPHHSDQPEDIEQLPDVDFMDDDQLEQEPPLHHTGLTRNLPPLAHVPLANDNWFVNSPVPQEQQQRSQTNQVQPGPQQSNQTQPRPQQPQQPQPGPQQSNQTQQPQPDLSSENMVQIKNESSSRKNFAVNLVRRVFSEEERARGNVRGRGKKEKLNEAKIGVVKSKTFEMWPLTTSENEKTAWQDCVVAIDEANRRLNRKK